MQTCSEMRVTGILAGSGILAVLIQPLVLKIPFIRVVLDWAVLQAIHSPTTFVCVSPVRFYNFQQAVLFFSGEKRIEKWHEKLLTKNEYVMLEPG